MDADRFARELPAHLADARFEDVLAEVPNLAAKNNLALVNLAARLLDPGESYVEVGAYQGASLIAALRGNDGVDAVAIDTFRFGPFEWKGKQIPAASREALDANLRRFAVSGATIIEGDAFELLEGGVLGERRVGACFYDASHTYEHTLRALRAIEPNLAPGALVIVDDSDWEEPSSAIADYLESQPRARRLLEFHGSSHGEPDWWEGVTVLVWS